MTSRSPTTWQRASTCRRRRCGASRPACRWRNVTSARTARSSGWSCSSRSSGKRRALPVISSRLSRIFRERKRLEEALRESERRFRTFVDHATDAFFLLDDRHVVLDVNRKACQSLGYTRDELVGKTAPDVDPDITPANIEEINRKLNAGETVAFESRHRRKDGTVFPVEVRGEAFWEGGRNFVVALARDMTERKHAEERCGESEQRFRILTEALPHWVWTARPDGALDYINSRTFEYTGSTPEQFADWDWRSYVHPEDLPRCFERWARSIATGEPYETEHRLLRADGAFRWHVASGAGPPRRFGPDHQVARVVSPTSMIRSEPRRCFGPASSGSGRSWTMLPTPSSCKTSSLSSST